MDIRPLELFNSTIYSWEWYNMVDNMLPSTTHLLAKPQKPTKWKNIELFVVWPFRSISHENLSARILYNTPKHLLPQDELISRRTTPSSGRKIRHWFGKLSFSKIFPYPDIMIYVFEKICLWYLIDRCTTGNHIYHVSYMTS